MAFFFAPHGLRIIERPAAAFAQWISDLGFTTYYLSASEAKS
jgi:hypothetical protein